MKRNYFWNPGYWNVQDKGIGSLALHVERLKAGTWLSSSCILLQWRNRLLSPYSDTNPDTNPAPNLQPSHHQQPYPFHVRDLSFYTWMTSHDLVHSTVTLVSSLRDSSFPAARLCLYENLIEIFQRTRQKLAWFLRWNTDVFNNLLTS